MRSSAVTLALARSGAWQLHGRLLALTAAPAAVVLGVVAITVPIVLRPVPSQELIDWWAAHDNPPIGFSPVLTELGRAVEERPRDIVRMESACRNWRHVASQLAEDPPAPIDLRADVATLSRDFVSTADRCLAEAATITKAQLEVSISTAASSEAARRLDDALRVPGAPTFS